MEHILHLNFLIGADIPQRKAKEPAPFYVTRTGGCGQLDGQDAVTPVVVKIEH